MPFFACAVQVFHHVAREVEGKSVADVIEFYYMWKKTYHYKQWKSMWRSEQSILRSQEDDTESDEEEEEEEEAEKSSRSSASSASGDCDRRERVEARGKKGGSFGRGSSS